MRPVTPEEKRDIFESRKRGYSWKRIADRLRRTAHTIQIAHAEYEAELFEFGPVRQARPRSCLGPNCLGKKTFMSEHEGHRLCLSCRKTVSGLSGVA